MGIYYLTYSYSTLIDGISIPSESIINATDSPYRFILYSTLVVAFVYFLVMSQTRRLIKNKKIIKGERTCTLFDRKSKGGIRIKKQEYY